MHGYSDLFRVAGTAALTATLALALWQPACQQAAWAESPASKGPGLTYGGIRMVLGFRQEPKEGTGSKASAVHVQLTNVSDEEKTVDAELQVMERPGMSVMSRALPRSRSLWSTPCKLTLAPHETRRFRLEPPFTVKPKVLSVQAPVADKAESGGLNKEAGDKAVPLKALNKMTPAEHYVSLQYKTPAKKGQPSRPVSLSLGTVEVLGQEGVFSQGLVLQQVPAVDLAK